MRTVKGSSLKVPSKKSIARHSQQLTAARPSGGGKRIVTGLLYAIKNEFWPCIK
jgi:hypothetical protein